MTINVWALFTEIMEYCWRERRAMLRYGLIPFVAASAVVLLLPDMRAPETPQGTKLVSALVAFLVQAVIYLPMTVTWYRMVVVNHDEALRRPLFTLGPREGRLLLWQLIIGILTGLAASAGAIVVALIFFLLKQMLGQGIAVAFAAIACALGLVLVLVLLSRLTFAVVLAATDQPASLRAAWRLTTGVSWPVTWVFILIGLAYALAVAASQLVAIPVGMVAAMAVGSTVGKIAPPLAGVIATAFGVVWFVANATLFGLVYRRLMEAQVARELAAELAPHTEAAPIP